MTKEEFMKNNRKCNGGEDFDPDYMSSLYDKIVTDEIKLSDKLAEKYVDPSEAAATYVLGGGVCVSARVCVCVCVCMCVCSQSCEIPLSVAHASAYKLPPLPLQLLPLHPRARMCV
jgi:hypothetical protein